MPFRIRLQEAIIPVLEFHCINILDKCLFLRSKFFEKVFRLKENILFLELTGDHPEHIPTEISGGYSG